MHLIVKQAYWIAAKEATYNVSICVDILWIHQCRFPGMKENLLQLCFFQRWIKALEFIKLITEETHTHTHREQSDWLEARECESKRLRQFMLPEPKCYYLKKKRNWYKSQRSNSVSLSSLSFHPFWSRSSSALCEVAEAVDSKRRKCRVLHHETSQRDFSKTLAANQLGDQWEEKEVGERWGRGRMGAEDHSRNAVSDCSFKAVRLN